MTLIKSNINTSNSEFSKNAEAMSEQVADLREKVSGIKLGGGEAYQARHVARGKLLPRERVHNLIDPGSPFLELSQLAAFQV